MTRFAVTLALFLMAQHTAAAQIVLFVSLESLMAAGRNTFVDDLLQHAGADNLAASAPGTYPALSRKAVLAPTIASLSGRFPEWTQLDAVRTGRVYRIDPDLVSCLGPRAVDGLEVLSHFLHADTQ